MDGRGDRGLVRELESNKASLNMKSFFGLELEVQELAGESRADDAAGCRSEWAIAGVRRGVLPCCCPTRDWTPKSANHEDQGHNLSGTFVVFVSLSLQPTS